jgi:hypothetical protein
LKVGRVEVRVKVGRVEVGALEVSGRRAKRWYRRSWLSGSIVFVSK